MNHSDIKPARLYRVSASDYPVEKYLFSKTAQEAAEEFAAQFDLGDLFDEVVITVSLCGARGDWNFQRFRVGSAQIRVYEAVALEEPGFVETDELEDVSDADLLEWADLATLEELDPGPDEEQTVMRIAPAAKLTESPVAPAEAEPSENESSGLRRLAGIASRGYGTLVRGLFGRLKAKHEAA